jgi:outer membrane protein OmpA-like peptidoglycan-associated protein
MKINSLLLAGTALLVLTAASPHAVAARAMDAPLLLAQNAPPAENQEKKPQQKPHGAPAKPPQPKAAPQPPKPPAPPPQQHQAPPAPPKPPTPPPAAAPKPPAAAPKPPAPAAPPPAHTQAAPPQQPPAGAPARQDRREDRRQDRREDRRDDRRDQRQEQRRQQPAPTQAPAAPPPAAAPKPAPTPAPQQQPAPQPSQQQQQPGQPQQQPAPQQRPQSAPQNTFRGPAPGAQPPQQQQQPPATAAPAAPPKPRDAREFIRRDNQGPTRTMEQVRSERQQTQQGNRTFIREGDRTIVKQDNRTIIRHSEAQRFFIGARDVRVDRRGNQTYTTIQRPNNITIVNITSPDGRLIRRVRRDAQGRQVVIIDNSFARPRESYFVDLPPPTIHIPRDRYVVDAWEAQPDAIFGVFTAPPVERLERRYTVEEVRYSEPLRARMPRVDLDINFDSGSWQLTPEQVDKLSVIADGLNRAISRNPREVFLIEGHTDATGNEEDNLSLSDRRAEAVAVALAEQFQVPAENLVTQGYGEQDLKDPTDGPSRVNRRVAVRRITPLIDQQAGGPPPRR